MKCFFILLTFVVGLLLPMSGNAENTTQFMLRNSMSEDNYIFPQTWFYLTHRENDNFFGFNGFAYALEGWGECYGGLSIYPVSQPDITLTFTAFGGVETTEGYWRVALDGLFIINNFSLYGLYEYGASKSDNDYFYSSIGYQVKDWLKPQIKTSKTGPTWRISGGAQFFIPNTPVSVEPIANYNFDSEEPEVDLSIYLDF